MSIVELIAIALAFGIEGMILMYQHVRPGSLRLTQGLLAAATFAIVYSFLFVAGQYIGSLLSFEQFVTTDNQAYNNANTLVFLGLTVITCLKMMLDMRRQRRSEVNVVFDLQRPTTVLAFALASGANVLIIALGVGFLPAVHSRWSGAAMLFVSVLLLSYFGVMFGRREVALRPRRWQFMAMLLLLATAVYQGVNM